MNEQEIQQRHIQFEFPFEKFNGNVKIGRYNVFQLMGQGSHAKVYRGMNEQTHQQVAVKVIDKQSVSKERNFNIRKKLRRLIQQESKIMMKINSDNVLKCYECYINDKYKIMFIEYCNQGCLADILENKKKIGEDEAISYLKQIVNGISACHEMKIIHRDIKLENIFVHNGVSKIADFGFAKALDIEDEQQMMTMTELGSYNCMAPQIMFKQPYGLKADIWSLGVIFYQMITGVFPFDSKQRSLEYLKKRIIQINEQKDYNGVTPSKEAKQFLKDVLVIDPIKRIGWRELLVHTILKDKKEKLPSTFFRKTDLKSKSQILETYQQLLQIKQNQPFIPPQNKNLKKQQIPSFKAIKNQNFIEPFKIIQHQQPKSISPVLREISKVESRILLEEQAQKANQKINRQDDVLYRWAKHIHNQCLRAQTIFQNIILVIQKHKIFDLTKVQIIQMMFLILTRCLNFMAPVKFQYEKRKTSQIIVQSYQTIQKLYENVKGKWATYARKLALLEEKQVPINDWYKKVIDSNNFNQNDKFFAGIQDMSQFRPQNYQIIKNDKKKQQLKQQTSFCDYTREEQIQFTFKHIQANIQKMMNEEKAPQLRSYLNNFKLICNLEAQTSEKQQFQYVLKIAGQEKKTTFKKIE